MYSLERRAYVSIGARHTPPGKYLSPPICLQTKTLRHRPAANTPQFRVKFGARAVAECCNDNGLTNQAMIYWWCPIYNNANTHNHRQRCICVRLKPHTCQVCWVFLHVSSIVFCDRTKVKMIITCVCVCVLGDTAGDIAHTIQVVHRCTRHTHTHTPTPARYWMDRVCAPK